MLVPAAFGQTAPAASPALTDQAIIDKLYVATLAGDTAAARSLGDLSAEGLLTSGRADWQSAARWYALAIDGAEPDADALFSLGHMSLMGRGLPNNEADARRLFLAAAEQNHAAALYWLGLVSARGIGGPVDIDTALAAYQRAASAGLEGADEALFELAGNVQGLPALGKVLRLASSLSGARAQTEITRNRLGSLSRSEIEALQVALQSAGFDPQGADGVMGPNSRAALTAFRVAQGRSEEAIVTLQDLRALGLI